MKKADMTLQNLVYLILFILLFGSIFFWASDKLKESIIDQGSDDFVSLHELTDNVFSKTQGTTFSVPFVLNENSAVVFFKDGEDVFEFELAAEISAGETTVSTSTKYKIERPVDEIGDVLCLCKGLDKKDISSSDSVYCGNKICFQMKDYGVVFNVMDCKTLNYDCVKTNGDRIILYAFDVKPYYSKRHDIFATNLDDKTIKVFSYNKKEETNA